MRALRDGAVLRHMGLVCGATRSHLLMAEAARLRGFLVVSDGAGG